MSIDLNKYLAVRWVAGGRAYPNLDCYGVVQEVRADLGLDAWPEYAGATQTELPDLATTAAGQRSGCDIEEGAVAFCYSGSAVTHVAVLVTIDGRMCALECSEAHNVTCLPLSRFERRYLRVEYYK